MSSYCHLVARRRSKFIRCLFIAIAVIGFMVQTAHISSQYFQYPTTTTILLVRSEMTTNDPIALCIRYWDIIDSNELYQKTGIRYKRIRNLEDAIYYDSKLTISQIFDLTPDVDDFIENCIFRPDEWNIFQQNKSTCRAVFNVTKFTTSDHICYRIEQIFRGARYYKFDISLSSLYRSELFHVTLTQRFADSDFVYGIAFSGELPHKSRESCPVIPRFKSVVGDNINTVYNGLHVTPSRTRIQLLSAPYETNCRHATPEVYYNCRTSCLIKKYKLIDRIPGYELITEKSDLRPMSTLNVSDDRRKEQGLAFWRACQKLCFFRPCVEESSKTTLLPILKSNVTFALSSVTPVDPDTLSHVQATMSFVEFLTLWSSCFGLWFGLSFLSLDPHRVFPSGRRRERVIVRLPCASCVCLQRPRLDPALT